jgi:hypothetical protein
MVSIKSFITDETPQRWWPNQTATGGYVEPTTTITFPQCSYQPQGVQMATIGVNKRLVRVLVVDSDKNVPVEKSKVFDSELFTDLSDEGIKLSLNLAAALEEHNKARTTFYRETDEGNKVFLKEAKITDLKIAILTIFAF